MTKDDNNNDITDMIDAAKDAYDKANEWWEENGDKVESIVPQGNGGSIDLTTPEPLRECHVNDDEVLIVAEVGSSDSNEMGLNFLDDKVEIIFGGERFVAEVPEDVVEDSIEASMKNGVLRVTMDRFKPESITVDNTVEVSSRDEAESTYEDIDKTIEELDEEWEDKREDIDEDEE